MGMRVELSGHDLFERTKSLSAGSWTSHIAEVWGWGDASTELRVRRLKKVRSNIIFWMVGLVDRSWDDTNL